MEESERANYASERRSRLPGMKEGTYRADRGMRLERVRSGDSCVCTRPGALGHERFT